MLDDLIKLKFLPIEEIKQLLLPSNKETQKMAIFIIAPIFIFILLIGTSLLVKIRTAPIVKKTVLNIKK